MLQNILQFSNKLKWYLCTKTANITGNTITLNHLKNHFLHYKLKKSEIPHALTGQLFILATGCSFAVWPGALLYSFTPFILSKISHLFWEIFPHLNDSSANRKLWTRLIDDCNSSMKKQQSSYSPVVLWDWSIFHNSHTQNTTVNRFI